MSSYNKELMAKLQENSKSFKNLKPQQQQFVAEYCLNGFSATDAAKEVGAKSSARFMQSDLVNEAIKEFMAFVLADKADKLESKIVDILWRRAFYDIMEFIDEEGQPRFDVNNYKEVLGPNAVVIENIKRMVHPKNEDHVWMEITFADRTKALKELSNYIGLAREDSGVPSSFVVNLNLNEDTDKTHVYDIKEYKDVKDMKSN